MPFCLETMKARSKTDPEPKLASALNVLLTVIRIHKRLGLILPPPLLSYQAARNHLGRASHLPAPYIRIMTEDERHSGKKRRNCEAGDGPRPMSPAALLQARLDKAQPHT